MRLTHPLLSAPIHWQENKTPVLVAENPKLFRQMVFSLAEQAQGEEGEFMLSLHYEPLDCGEHLHVLRDYVHFPLDDRKLQNRFQARLQQIVREELAEETDGLQQAIAGYLEKVVMAMEWPISLSGGEYALPLLKTLKCQPVLDGKEPLERLMQYLDLYHTLLKDQCFVLVGARAYFSSEEMEGFYAMAHYKKWRVLLLEQHRPTPLPGESYCLLDDTLCELRLDFPPDFR